MKKNELKFKNLLQQQLKDFNLQKAELLSMAIHEAESKGYEVSKSEDRLWMELTSKIIDMRDILSCNGGDCNVFSRF